MVSIQLPLFLVLSVICCDAMIDRFNHLKIGYGIRSIHQFEFDGGGKLTLSGNVHVGDNDNDNDDDADDDSLYLFHCTDDEMEQLNKYSSMHKLCANIDNFECSYSLSISNENENQDIEYSFHSVSKQWMTMLIISCSENHKYDVSNVNLISTSDGNHEYLSVNEMNYKFIFLYLSIIYILLFLIYAVHLCYFRHFNISLQILLIWLPFMKCIACVFNHFFWNTASLHGTTNILYQTLFYIFDALCDGLFAVILLFICFGWKFINNSITDSRHWLEILQIVMICLFIMIASIVQHYYSSLLLFSVISYTLCARVMFKAYSQNIQLLQTQIEILLNDQSEDVVNKSPANIKLNILKLFQKLVVALMAFKISLYWISSLLLFEYQWINDLIANILIIGFTAFLFWNFRMNRAFKPYFYLIDQNVEEYEGNKAIATDSFQYNLSFESDMLIVENAIDYLNNSDIIKNYSLSTPLTIDLHNNYDHYDANDFDENTPLLIK